MSDFDPARFTTKTSVDTIRVSTDRRPRTRQCGRFVRGPIPVHWLQRAAVLRGKALAVGLALWFKAGLTKSNRIQACHSLWQEFGIGQDSAYNGLKALEKVGLITVVRHSGRCPIVTITETKNQIEETQLG